MLAELDSWYSHDLPTAIAQRRFLTRPELCKLMQWKLKRGKFRPNLQRLVESNSDESVKTSSSKAFAQCAAGQVKAAIQELCNLKGVGPATASGKSL